MPIEMRAGKMSEGWESLSSEVYWADTLMVTSSTMVGIT